MYAFPAGQLSRFSLDFFGPRVTEVRVNGRSAGFSRKGGKLTVVPKQAVPAGEYFTVAVATAACRRKSSIPTAPARVVPHRRRRPRRRRAAGHRRLDPLRQRPQRQGDLRLRRHRAEAAQGDRQRPPAPRHPPRRADHLRLARRAADEPLPGGGRHRPRQDRQKSRPRVPGLHAGRPAVGAALAAGTGRTAGDRPLRERALRALPLRLGGLDRRLRAEARLRAGDPEPADLPLRPRPDHGRPRDRAPVVRRLGRAEAVARNLAQRGLRDLDRVVLRRAPRPPQRPGDLQPPLPGARLERGVLGPADRPSRHARSTSSAPPSTSAGRWRWRRCG